jgi:hypothetical protein
MKNRNRPTARLTRRQLAGAILATAAAAQTPPSTPAQPSTPDGELQAALEQNQRTGEALAKVKVPIETEPAFHFTA